jgi:hypothetical protein
MIVCIVAAVTVCMTGLDAHGAVNVVNSDDAEALVNNILGEGITLVGLPSYNGASVASGFFANGLSSGIGIKDGIILTSGMAVYAQGGNSNDAVGQDSDRTGDADLDSLSGGYTHDAAVLEFDFGTSGGDLYFNYVFASEEYNEYTNSPYNDVFAFLLDGKNIAMIPGTDIPVSVNSVNGGNPLGVGPSHPEFFNNNDLNDGGPFFDFQYDGFTDVFTAEALDLASGVHHIKLAIADTGDGILDSAVFIQGGTFSDTPTPPESPVPAPGALLLVALGSSLTGWLRQHRTV